MNAATQPATATASNIVALETLTVGLPVRITLTSGRVIEGYVYSTETLSITGFNAVISTAGKSVFLLHHYLSPNKGLSKTVGCTRHASIRVSHIGGVASIESLA